MKKLVVLTGAGVSAESGLKTFRDADGLWEGHDVMQVASPEGFHADPGLVLDFYNQRRRQLKQAEPNSAHRDIAELQSWFDVKIITQNVDDLHERAGSHNVMHLHGELFKVRSTYDEFDVMEWRKDLILGDLCQRGYQLRPHIVWFGEAVPLIPKAMTLCEQADLLLIVGTSLQVYPAASLMHYVASHVPIFYIDPKPAINSNSQIEVVAEPATIGMKTLKERLINQFY
ncbi:MAG: NAD-dependent deacylase [Flavobacteriaceae bacterium]|nr:NAD-dependent deacylase [Bacteroidia bacterium]MBT8287475.1 NAD-dependent deacylase [Bacteroidia bacterium]NNF75946.1 NAD-dependent deacylase [Flavobacteriaceae bacterium]NNK73870.1 NAD-dependent deacylase [Flavobacteriaceae bacterium]